jgi:DNA-binding transcriptional ArsR family regulator
VSVERARPTLRALRQEPLLVDDLEVARRLAAVAPVAAAVHPAAAADPDDAPADGAADLARWARAWLVSWQAALAADPRYGLDEPWTLGVPFAQVVAPKGGGDRTRRAAALALLARAGVLTGSPKADGSGDGVARVARACFAPHAAAVAVDWPTVVAASAAEPAALLTFRALAELLVPLDGTSAVPRRDLVARTGYGATQVRVALRRLVAAGLLDASGESGTTGRYRLTARALGRDWGAGAGAVPPVGPAPAAVRAPAPPAAPVVAAPAAPVAVPPVAAAPAAGAGLEVVAGGVTIALAPGTPFRVSGGVAVELTVGPDGQLRLVVGAPPAQG